MRLPISSIVPLLGLAVLGACASADIEKRQSYAANEQLPRPGRIIVYNIGATEDDLPASSALTGYYSRSNTTASPDEIRLGRELGEQIASRLVANFMKLGMPAQRAGHGPPPQVGDVVLTGQFITIDEGDKKQRVMIGFGKGSGDLTTHIEGYLVMEDGHRLLGTRQVGAEGGKKPGMILPVAGALVTKSPVGLIVGSGVNIQKEISSETLEGAAERTADAIAEELGKVFRNQGWI